MTDASRRLRRGDMRQVVKRYSVDEGNVRAALQWYLDAHDGNAVVQIGLSAWPLWFTQGRYSEGLATMERALGVDSTLTDQSRTDARLVLGMMAFESGDYARAESVLEPVLDQYVQRADALGVATASVPLGMMAGTQHSGAGDDMLRQAIDSLRHQDDRWGLAFALLALGTTLVIGHREADAIEPLEEGARIARAGDETIMLSNALIGLGWAHMGQHDLAAAYGSLGEGLDLAVEFANQETIARALDAFAAMADDTGDASQGAILFGAAQGMRRSIGANVWAIDRASYDDTSKRLHTRLGDQTYQRLARQGATLALDDVLHIAAGLGTEGSVDVVPGT